MQATTIKEFVTGSQTFFMGMPNYHPHDSDTLAIIDYPIFGRTIAQMRKDGNDVFFIPNLPKDELILITLENDTPMAICKFLNPDFANYLDMNIDDLLKLKSLSDKMDDKHHYLKMIYDFYIDNNGFYLTDEQRELAYQEYLSKR